MNIEQLIQWTSTCFKPFIKIVENDLEPCSILVIDDPEKLFIPFQGSILFKNFVLVVVTYRNNIQEPFEQLKIQYIYLKQLERDIRKKTKKKVSPLSWRNKMKIL